MTRKIELNLSNELPGIPDIPKEFLAPQPVPERGYSSAALPPDEAKRLNILRSYNILDTEAEQCYDDLTSLASIICGTPIALVSLVDEDRQWFKSRLGMEADATSRELSFCAHAILRPDRTFEVQNTLEDRRFAGHPLVRGGPEIRFYAGVPIVTPDGSPMGTICVIDRKPRALTVEQDQALHCLARQVASQLELRSAVTKLQADTRADPLTLVPTRKAFDLHFDQEWTRHRASGALMGLLMVGVDLDSSLSHREGDRALTRSARLLGATLRSKDYLARFGAEEFAMLLPNSNLDQTTEFAEMVCRSVAASDWGAKPVTVSIGVDAAMPARDLDRNSSIARIDRALYHAKRAGGNRVVVFNEWT